MGQPATRVTPDAALDRFFDHYYRARPVQATFTGVHDYDHQLPDWSPEGLEAQLAEMRELRGLLGAVGGPKSPPLRTGEGRADEPGGGPSGRPTFPMEIDLALADAFLEVQIAEHESGLFVHRNPALWTGEAIFGIIALVTRPFAPLDMRLDAAIARLGAVPPFSQRRGA